MKSCRERDNKPPKRQTFTHENGESLIAFWVENIETYYGGVRIRFLEAAAKYLKRVFRKGKLSLR